MPRVNVVLRNGTTIPVEGGNSAYWSENGMAAVIDADRAKVLIVQLVETNKTETKAIFKSGEVAGYVIED